MPLTVLPFFPLPWRPDSFEWVFPLPQTQFSCTLLPFHSPGCCFLPQMRPSIMWNVDTMFDDFSMSGNSLRTIASLSLFPATATTSCPCQPYGPIDLATSTVRWVWRKPGRRWSDHPGKVFRDQFCGCYHEVGLLAWCATKAFCTGLWSERYCNSYRTQGHSFSGRWWGNGW